MKGDLEADEPLQARNVCFQPIPRNGSRYDLILAEDPHGGVLVIWPTVATYRWYRGDRLKFLHGSENKVDQQAIYDYLESRYDAGTRHCRGKKSERAYQPPLSPEHAAFMNKLEARNIRMEESRLKMRVLLPDGEADLDVNA